MSRLAIVERKKCNPANCGDYLCIRVCPVNRRGEECISKAGRAAIDEGLCIGCGICVKKCPFNAISIINLPEQLRESPVHCFGRNGFHLYSLPMPIFGKVVGIIGRNGVGKTTAINILSGLLKPNLGVEGREASLRELVEHFKGSELHNYFELLHQGRIRVSVKPQQVSLIPKRFRGKVGELLSSMDEKKSLTRVIEALQLKGIMERGIDQISGGELQKVAIAAAALKNANVYFFDEPTSYLDIRQRIVVSGFIQSLAESGAAVVVIEHDLIILDYLSELLHITFGQPSAYGVISGPKATRDGINEYLTGMLRKENLRFRDSPILFEEKPPAGKSRGELILEWQGLRKSLGNFQFSAKGGGISKRRVVGVLGENGIGKTTFMRILAGELKPDAGNVSCSVGLSYKPQYIDTDSEMPVREFLKDAISVFMNELVHPLELEPLMDEKLKELSGGELQRVMIAKCLSNVDASLFIMDEPSAYLDVEQRLIASKLIRKFMETSGKGALVVDHDLLFADYLSDELIVFEGKPSVEGELLGPFPMEQGMNMLLKKLEITLRRDIHSKRPRINKQGSRLDTEQKNTGRLYYA